MDLESLDKIGRQVFVSLGTRKCDLEVSVSAIPSGHKGKECWDGVFRAKGHGWAW
jgi:hypothetical protein